MNKNLNYILHFRKLRKLTQQEMADELGMSQRNYSRIENSQVAITIQQIRKISQVLNISIDDLLGEQESINKTDNNSNTNIELYERILKKQNEEIEYLKSLINLKK